MYISLVYPGEKEVIKKDKRRKGRLEYRTLYAMRRHKAWRGGSNAQQSCVPATALGVWLFVNRLRTESIDFWCSWNKKVMLVLREQKILIFGVPGTENIDF